MGTDTKTTENQNTEEPSCKILESLRFSDIMRLACWGQCGASHHCQVKEKKHNRRGEEVIITYCSFIFTVHIPTSSMLLLCEQT